MSHDAHLQEAADRLVWKTFVQFMLTRTFDCALP